MRLDASTRVSAVRGGGSKLTSIYLGWYSDTVDMAPGSAADGSIGGGQRQAAAANAGLGLQGWMGAVARSLEMGSKVGRNVMLCPRAPSPHREKREEQRKQGQAGNFSVPRVTGSTIHSRLAELSQGSRRAPCLVRNLGS
jgi:hypothetical protein